MSDVMRGHILRGACTHARICAGPTIAADLIAMFGEVLHWMRAKPPKRITCVGIGSQRRLFRSVVNASMATGRLFTASWHAHILSDVRGHISQCNEVHQLRMNG